MGYLHINNLYKDQTILLFKECYAMEKIHGTSAHIHWNGEVHFFSGGEKHENFIQLFDSDFLKQKFQEDYNNLRVTVYGEAYGGKQQRMSETYGKNLKFIAFDVSIGNSWLNVSSAEKVCNNLGIEFVDYVKCSTDLDTLDFERDKPSTQAIRNGCGEKPREGVVLRPLVEVTLNNGDRVISKHKGDAFKETSTPRKVQDNLDVLTEARAIADEWVTEMRLTHVLDKLPDVNIEDTRLVINAMIEDVHREAKDEIVENKNVTKAIGNRTAMLFKQRLQGGLRK